MVKGIHNIDLEKKNKPVTELENASTVSGVELESWTGLVVHIDDTLGNERRSDIEHALNAWPGIIRARFNAKRPHLLLVDYDRTQTTSLEILHQVERQSVHAQLIGPI